MSKLTITIDGPAGSGKSSVARRVAALLGYSYLDSGAMYRALALKALERKVALDDLARIEALAKETHIELKPPTLDLEAAGAKNRVFLDGKEVTRGFAPRMWRKQLRSSRRLPPCAACSSPNSSGQGREARWLWKAATSAPWFSPTPS